jgi:hypothetical protein
LEQPAEEPLRDAFGAVQESREGSEVERELVDASFAERLDSRR